MNLKLLLTSFTLTLSICSFSQESNKAYAITGSAAGDFQWMNIRQIDLSTGAVTKNIFEKGVTTFQLKNVSTGKELALPTAEGKQLNTAEYPTATMVAA